MKIFVSHSREFDFQSELYAPLRSSDISTHHELFLPHDTGSTIDTHDTLMKADLILAEVSFPSLGEGIELGWANAAGKRILCISKEGAKVSEAVKYIASEMLTYTDSVDMLEKVRTKI